MDDLYLEHFVFPSEDSEFRFFVNLMQRIHTSYYPFQVIRRPDPVRIDFAPVTILYGGNGSGKTTALNVIAETLQIKRDAPYNRSDFFEAYTDLCSYKLGFPYRGLPETSRIVTSDDVFDFALTLRTLNESIDEERVNIKADYLQAKYADFQMKSLEDYERLKQVNLARRKTQSKFVTQQLMGNVRTHSNGENGFRYFTERLDEPGLYLLDEPENSLSPAKQEALAQYIIESVRACECQVIMATHSPFMLAIPGAKIYNLDSEPVTISHWTELDHVKAYRAFFKRHESDF